MPANAPVPGKFDQDPRVHFDKTAGKWQYEDEESGQEYEWSDAAKTWIPLVDEEQWKAQQAAYSVAGVDEDTPANAVLAREQKREQQRKKKTGANNDFTSNGAIGIASSSKASSSKQPQQPSAPKKTGVWVTNLPPNTTPELLSSVFSKAGVLLIDDEGEPRIKLYYDDEGKFKGEALILYFKEGSVDLAVTLLDDTELEMGAGFGNMRVKEAEYGGAQSGSAGQPKADKPANGATTGTDGQDKEKDKKRKGHSAEQKAKMTKRIRTMQDKLTWHSDSDEDDLGAPNGGAPQPGASRFNRVVVLKGMFKLEDLDKEPELLLELKEDVREEAETMGQVTSVILYDKEEDGVMTIKFKEPISAQACVMKMNGRFFDGRKIYAGIYTGKERFKKSGAGVLEDDENEEKERLDNFAHWLVDGDEAES